MELEMTEMNTPMATPEPRNRSTGALILFLLFAVPIPICLLIYHFILWSTEQTAIADASEANLAWAGLIGVAAQALIMTGISAALWRFTTDERFKPVYGGWLAAAATAFPALLLRLLGPNNDQLGSILQILICVIAALIVSRARSVKIDWRANRISLAFFLAAFGVAPFAIFGALGAPTDVMLDLLAGLSLGWLAALLMEATTGNYFLDAFGIGAVLALLGSAIGYDGAQLILIALLPGFAFAIATLMPSRAAAFVLTGLLTAAGLTFFDPTELTIVLGDESGLAIKAVEFAVGLGLVVGLIGLIVRYVAKANTVPRLLRALS